MTYLVGSSCPSNSRGTSICIDPLLTTRLWSPRKWSRCNTLEEMVKTARSSILIYLGAWNLLAARRKALTISRSDAIKTSLEKNDTILLRIWNSKPWRKKKSSPLENVQQVRSCNMLWNQFSPPWKLRFERWKLWDIRYRNWSFHQNIQDVHLHRGCISAIRLIDIDVDHTAGF